MDKLSQIQKNWPTDDLPLADYTKGEKQKYYGWFSQKQVKSNFNSKSQIIIYLNEQNEEVQVTNVGRSATPCLFFDDIVFKGIVLKYVRTIKL